jgi:Fe-Mn family superoxide dismutase
MATYTKKDFSALLGTEGFSDTLLNNHFTLYEGYVNNTNTLIEKLETMAPGTPEYAELKRRFGWEWNGMRLHELYFENMTKEVTAEPSGELLEKLNATYESFAEWQTQFVGTGTMRGIGWVVMTYDESAEKIFTTWVNEHDMGILAGTKILLIMDVFEHAFLTDYGIKRADYIQNFLKHIDWDVVANRLTA